MHNGLDVAEGRWTGCFRLLDVSYFNSTRRSLYLSNIDKTLRSIDISHHNESFKLEALTIATCNLAESRDYTPYPGIARSPKLFHDSNICNLT
jgi:hypothetical protein